MKDGKDFIVNIQNRDVNIPVAILNIRVFCAIFVLGNLIN